MAAMIATAKTIFTICGPRRRQRTSRRKACGLPTRETISTDVIMVLTCNACTTQGSTSGHVIVDCGDTCGPYSITGIDATTAAAPGDGKPQNIPGSFVSPVSTPNRASRKTAHTTYSAA